MANLATLASAELRNVFFFSFEWALSECDEWQLCQDACENIPDPSFKVGSGFEFFSTSVLMFGPDVCVCGVHAVYQPVSHKEKFCF